MNTPLDQKIDRVMVSLQGQITEQHAEDLKEKMKDLAEWVYKALDVGSFVDGTGDVEDPFELYKRTALKIGIIKE